jgi:hypothetical protein
VRLPKVLLVAALVGLLAILLWLAVEYAGVAGQLAR